MNVYHSLSFWRYLNGSEKISDLNRNSNLDLCDACALAWSLLNNCEGTSKMKHIILYSRFCPTKVVAWKAKNCPSPNIWKDYKTKIFARLLSTQMISTATKGDALSINMKSIKWKQAEPAFFIIPQLTYFWFVPVEDEGSFLTKWAVCNFVSAGCCHLYGRVVMRESVILLKWTSPTWYSLAWRASLKW